MSLKGRTKDNRRRCHSKEKERGESQKGNQVLCTKVMEEEVVVLKAKDSRVSVCKGSAGSGLGIMVGSP